MYQQILPLIALWEGGVVPANPSSGTSLCSGEEHGTGSGGDSHAGAEGEPDSLVAHAQHITSSKLRRASILEQ